MSDEKKVAVIGGGAAGMTSAYFLAKNGFEVTVFEHSGRVGKKLAITGKGRCNVTNDCDRETFLSSVTRNPKFLYNAYSLFPPQRTMEFFESLGVKLKVERGNRVFPVSDRAEDIVSSLFSACREAGVSFVYENVKKLSFGQGVINGVTTDKKSYPCDVCLLATGGKSYPRTGSDGSGYALAESAGHTVTPIFPSLVPLETEEDWVADAMGLSLKNCGLRVVDEKGKRVYEDFGEMLFTHFGVSGPMILSSSAHLRGEGKKYALEIDLKPALDEKTLDRRLLSEFSGNENKNFSNVLPSLLPSKLIGPFIRLSGINKDRKVNSITKEERASIVRLLKCVRLNVKGFRPIDEAVVTSGGVSVKEVDPSSMRSKICDNLYFAGEILDLDAYTGGFNLQIAFMTAYSAAEGITASFR